MQEGAGSIQCVFGCFFFSTLSFIWWMSWRRQFPAVKGRRNAPALMCVSTCVEGEAGFLVKSYCSRDCNTDPWDSASPNPLSFIYCTWQRHCLGNHHAPPFLTGAFCVIGWDAAKQQKEQDKSCLAQDAQRLIVLVRGNQTPGKCCTGLFPCCCVKALGKGLQYPRYCSTALALGSAEERWLQHALPLAFEQWHLISALASASALPRWICAVSRDWHREGMFAW